MSIPISQFISLPPFSPGNHKFVFYICALQVPWEAWNKSARFQELSLIGGGVGGCGEGRERLEPPGGQVWLVLWCPWPVCSLCPKLILC